MIDRLNDDEVFIFGSNSEGFHGAGAAGLACRGTSKNTWRTDPWFLRAMRAPVGSPDRIGKWAVYGIARGYQVGCCGCSYAIETIVRPGWKRSTPITVIQDQLIEMFKYASWHDDQKFLMSPVGAGLAGWTDDEMLSAWNGIFNWAPRNIIVPNNLYKNVDIFNT